MQPFQHDKKSNHATCFKFAEIINFLQMSEQHESGGPEFGIRINLIAIEALAQNECTSSQSSG